MANLIPFSLLRSEQTNQENFLDSRQTLTRDNHVRTDESELIMLRMRDRPR